MTEKKLYLILQSVLCVLLAVLLAASAVSIYREGKARKAEDPMEPIYTREKAAEKFDPIAPLLFGTIGLTAAGWILAVRDENAEKPAADIEPSRDRFIPPVENPKAKRALQAALIAAALVFIVLGVINGSAKAVLIKAVNICTECIGLG